MTPRPPKTALMQRGDPLRASIRSGLRGAGGGSGGSAHVPIEQPDSLRSIAYARILDLVSEGEIEGFALGADHALECIFLDKTPIGNADGTLNFQNVEVDSRSGTQDQTFMTGFPAVENETVIGVELKFGTPFTRSITDLDLTAIRVRLSVPIGLQKSNTATGDINGYRIAYTIEIKADAGAYVKMIDGAFGGKASGIYERSHRLDLPPATTGWTLRVTRTTTNANSATVADTTDVVSVADIIDGKFRYPNCALVGIVVDASQFQNIPTRAYHLKGRIVSVPSNYNPVTRAYTGTWDGTFKPAYTNNPAWVYYDIATNPRFALGDRTTPAQVNKWALYAIGQYCDGMVPDGKGGTEPRFVCNAYLQSRADAYKVLNDLATVFRGMSYYVNGMIQAIADMPSDPVYTYTEANVVVSSGSSSSGSNSSGIAFSYQGSALATRFTQALVSWNDPANFYSPAVEPVPDPDGVARFGINQTEVTAVGCTSQGQAQRLGRWTLLTSRYEGETCTFTVGLDGTLALPGQVVRIADPNRMGRRVAGRISSATSTSITVDKLPTVSIGDTVTVTLPSGVTESHAVTAISGKTISVAGPGFSAIPLPQSIWLVESSALTAPTYRILSRKDNGDLTYTLTALRNIASKYSAVDNDTIISIPPTSLLLPKVQPAPTSLTMTAAETAGSVNSSTVLSIAWVSAPYAVEYLVEYQANHGEWIPLAKRTGLSVDVQHIQPGDYLARVTAFNAAGNASLPTVSSTLTVVDQTLMPESVADAAAAAAAGVASAAAANAALADIASDNMLTPNEKPVVIRDVNVINTEQAGIDAQAVAFSITSEKTAYDNAVNALNAYLATLTSPTLWSNLTGNTVIVGPTFRANFATVYTTRQTLLNAIYAAAQALANAAQATANAAQLGIRNPRFEVDTLHWGFTTPTQYGRGTNPTTSPDINVSTYCSRTGQAGSVHDSAESEGFLTVSAGQVCCATAAIRNSSMNSTAFAQVTVDWYTQSGTFIKSSFSTQACGPGLAGSLNVGTLKATDAAPADGFCRMGVYFTNHTSGFCQWTSCTLTNLSSSQDEVPDSATYLRGTTNQGSAVSLRNPNFELPIDAQGNIVGCRSHSGGVLSLTTSIVFDGSQSLKVTNAGGGVSGVELDAFQCGAGDVIAARCSAYSGSGVPAFLTISFYGTSGFLSSFSTQGTAFNTWQTLSIAASANAAAPAGTTYCLILGYQTTNTGISYFDNFLVTRTLNLAQHVRGTFPDTGYLPAVAVSGFSAGWSGMSATYSVPITGTTVTFTTSAATLRSGSLTYSYSGSSATATQARGTTVTYYLYYDGGTGGAPALQVTTSSLTALAGDSRVIITQAGIVVTVPASGTGGSGGGGIGCPVCEAWVIKRDIQRGTDRVYVRAGEIVEDDYLLLASGQWGRVSHSRRVLVPCVRVSRHKGSSISCSTTAPLGLVGGGSVLAPDAASQRVEVLVNEVKRSARIAAVHDIGRRWVQHITCQDDFFWVGDDPDCLFSHHNYKPAQ